MLYLGWPHCVRAPLLAEDTACSVPPACSLSLKLLQDPLVTFIQALIQLPHDPQPAVTHTGSAPGFAATHKGSVPGFAATHKGSDPGFAATQKGSVPGLAATQKGSVPGFAATHKGSAPALLSLLSLCRYHAFDSYTCSLQWVETLEL